MKSLRSVLELLQAAAQDLQGVSDAPRLDSERLLLHVLNQSETSWVYAHGEERLSAEARAAFWAGVEERKAGKPLAYILGEWDFYGRTFYVNSDVLIPRPETEELVRQAMSIIQQHAIHNSPFTIADIGTGSGCIVITLALELASLRLPARFSFKATDISRAALAVAQKNAERHRLQHQITFLQGDMFEPLQGGRVDLIVSNPPYVTSQELGSASRARDARGLLFEPRQALDGGEDGQLYVKKISASGIPALVESTGGQVRQFHWPVAGHQSAEK